MNHEMSKQDIESMWIVTLPTLRFLMAGWCPKAKTNMCKMSRSQCVRGAWMAHERQTSVSRGFVWRKVPCTAYELAKSHEPQSPHANALDILGCRYPSEPREEIKVCVKAGNGRNIPLTTAERDQRVVKVELTR